MAKQTILGTTNLSLGKDIINENFTEVYNKTTIEENPTTTALTLANLNATYTSKEIGFRVLCKDVIGGGLIYTKVDTGWISNLITDVV